LSGLFCLSRGEKCEKSQVDGRQEGTGKNAQGSLKGKKIKQTFKKVKSLGLSLKIFLKIGIFILYSFLTYMEA
jgi:hypothetical protein